MKVKRWLVPLTLAVILVGVTGWLGAQDAPAGPTHRAGLRGGHHGGPGEFGDIGRLLNMLQNANDLDVTDEQIAQIEAVIENARPQLETLREQLQTQRETWQEANDPAIFDETASREFIEAQSTLHADLMLLGMQTRAEALSVLTPEQQDALKDMKKCMRKGPRGKRQSKRPR